MRATLAYQLESCRDRTDDELSFPPKSSPYMMSRMSPARMRVRIRVHVQPRAAKTSIAGMHDGSIKIRLAAPPVDGAANAALIEFVADRFGIAKSRVRLVSGASSRRKVLEIEGVDAATVSDVLPGCSAL